MWPCGLSATGLNSTIPDCRHAMCAKFYRYISLCAHCTLPCMRCHMPLLLVYNHHKYSDVGSIHDVNSIASTELESKGKESISSCTKLQIMIFCFNSIEVSALKHLWGICIILLIVLYYTLNRVCEIQIYLRLGRRVTT